MIEKVIPIPKLVRSVKEENGSIAKVWVSHGINSENDIKFITAYLTEIYRQYSPFSIKSNIIEAFEGGEQVFKEEVVWEGISREENIK